jgi:type IV pilus assembly protein PilC
MPEFVCKYGTPSGEVVEKAVSSPNEQLLKDDFEKKGYLVFYVKPKSGLGALLSGKKMRSKRISLAEFMIFNHELATLIHAGLPILTSLDILVSRMKNELLRETLQDIREQVKSGVSLSDAFAGYPHLFPKMYSASLKAGERSGDLESVLRRYIGYVKIVSRIKKKIAGSLVYPAILMGLSVAVVIVLLHFVIPRFTEFYQDFEMELPVYSQLIIGASQVVQKFGIFVLLGAIAGAFALRKFLRTQKGSHVMDTIRLRIPFLGEIWEKYALSQLARALGTLLAGGIPLVSALETAAGAIGNRVVGQAAADSVQRIREGESLSSALERTGVATDLVIEMIRVGESTGSLQEMLLNISDYYDEEIENSINKVLALIEPIILVCMGIIIAGMLASIYIPIFQTIQAVH